MELLFITFSKVSEKLIRASLSLRNDKKARCILEIEGVSRKQCAFNFCKQDLISWDLFAQLKTMALTQGDPRFCKVARHRQSALEARGEKLADICDDMRCSVHEAEQFLDNDIMPSNW